MDSGEPCGDAGNCPFAQAQRRRDRRCRQADADQHDRQQQRGRRRPRERRRRRRHLDRHQRRRGSADPDQLDRHRNSASVSTRMAGSPGGGIEVQDGETFSFNEQRREQQPSTSRAPIRARSASSRTRAGIHVGGLGTATIQGSRITGNVASANDAAGAPGAGSGALGVGFSDFCVCDQTLVLKDTLIAGNRTRPPSMIRPRRQRRGDRHAASSPTPPSIGNSISVTSLTGAAIAGRRVLRLRRRGPAHRGQEQRGQRRHGEGSSTWRFCERWGSRAHPTAVCLSSTTLWSPATPEPRPAPRASPRAGGSGTAGPSPRRAGSSLLLDRTDRHRQPLSAGPGLAVRGGGLFTDGFPV